ncbi:MAG: hypothetical protein CFH01_00840 [Alphaproteobacteria bacterium MarineAlpha2_Bin1]|nr:MAG: hypothetical protein CFH01_00840 [Alphaproteobacteria bacterium MarineAlpha2_Bin1]
MDRVKPNLGEILGATVMTPNIEETIKPYIEIFEYHLISDNVISNQLSNLWNAKAHFRAESKIIAPKNKSYPWIRFICAPEVANYKAMTSYGWHSLEINVQNVDQIPNKLTNSNFKIIGEPHQLGMSKSIRAMQVIGYAKEVIYLTEIPNDDSVPHLPVAENFVDKIFIVPLGTSNMDETRAWYINNFPNINKGIEARGIKMALISDALGIDPNTKCSICTIRLPNKSSIEIDDYPNAAVEREFLRENLPPGISIVSFEIDSLDKVKVPFMSEISLIEESPYENSRVGVIRGSASEIIELIERK